MITLTWNWLHLVSLRQKLFLGLRRTDFHWAISPCGRPLGCETPACAYALHVAGLEASLQKFLECIPGLEASLQKLLECIPTMYHEYTKNMCSETPKNINLCISKCANWARRISGCDTVLDFHVKFDISIVGLAYCLSIVVVCNLCQKLHLWNMFPTKCQGCN